MKKIKTQTLGAMELRTRFEENRRDHFTTKIEKIEARVRDMNRRLSDLRDKRHEHSEKAAGLRGLTSRMREKGYDMMSTEYFNGINSATFFHSPRSLAAAIAAKEAR